MPPHQLTAALATQAQDLTPARALAQLALSRSQLTRVSRTSLWPPPSEPGLKVNTASEVNNSNSNEAKSSVSVQVEDKAEDLVQGEGGPPLLRGGSAMPSSRDPLSQKVHCLPDSQSRGQDNSSALGKRDSGENVLEAESETEVTFR